MKTGVKDFDDDFAFNGGDLTFRYERSLVDVEGLGADDFSGVADPVGGDGHNLDRRERDRSSISVEISEEWDRSSIGIEISKSGVFICV